MHQSRHTFCSRLASRGAPIKAIQELAGHEHLSTTMQYMHIAPFTREAAIRLLDEPEAITTRPHHGSRGELGRRSGGAWP
jgi:integrase